MDRFLKILTGAFEHLIVAALVGLGTWLAATRVPDETDLLYTKHISHVGTLSTWEISLSNQTNSAIALEFKQPSEKIVTISFDQPSSSAATSSTLWTGQLLIGQTLSVLAVVENSEVEPSSSWLAHVVTATYQERDEKTGLLRPRTASFREASAISISRTALRIIWFLLPFLVTGLILAVVWLRKRKKQPAAPVAIAAPLPAAPATPPASTVPPASAGTKS